MQVIDWYNNAFLPKVKTKLIDVIITSSEFVQERDKSEKEAIRIVEEAGYCLFFGGGRKSQKYSNFLPPKNFFEMTRR